MYEVISTLYPITAWCKPFLFCLVEFLFIVFMLYIDTLCDCFWACMAVLMMLAPVGGICINFYWMVLVNIKADGS